MDVMKWVRESRHLPAIMRNFHDQKDIFKLLQNSVERDKARDQQAHGRVSGPLEHQNWIDSQIYVVDYFLYIMAKYGYTLQKTRAHVEGLADIHEDIRLNKEKEAEILNKFLDNR